MTERGPVEFWLTDMDGVLVREGLPVPGAPELVGWLRASGKPFLVLTGISTRADVDRYPDRPSRVVNSVVDLVDEI